MKTKIENFNITIKGNPFNKTELHELHLALSYYETNLETQIEAFPYMDMSFEKNKLETAKKLHKKVIEVIKIEEAINNANNEPNKATNQ